MTLSLDIDAGNSRLKWRLRCNTTITARGEIPSESFTREKLVDSVGSVPGQVNLCSVARPEIAEIIADLCGEWSSQLFVARTLAFQFGLKCGYLDPESLGADRWMAMLAAFDLCPGGAVVVDAGSAITVDLIERGGVHCGGYIVPGYRMLCQSLSKGTALVRPDASASVSTTPGRCTEDAVNNGIMAMIEGLLAGVLEQAASNDDSPGLYLTGGDAGLLHQLLGPGWCLKPDLVLDGLCLASKLEDKH